MKVYLAVLSRELKRRKMIWLGALIAGLLPFLIAALPGLGYRYGEVRDAFACSTAVGLGVILALILGGTMIGRDISEGRFGFDFSRPMSGLAIWGGRFTATVLLVWGIFFVSVLPATITGGGLFRLATPDNPLLSIFTTEEIHHPALFTLLLFVILLVGLVALAHTIGTIMRVRSAWIFLDLAGVILFLLFSFFSLYHFYSMVWMQYRPIQIIGIYVLVLIFMVGLVLAGAAQVCRGRTDGRAGHKAMSITLWSVCLGGSLMFMAYSHWYTDVSIRDIGSVDFIRSAPEGNWIFASCRARHRFPKYFPLFLFNTVTKKGIRVSGMPYAPFFSTDGSRCVWVDHDFQKPSLMAVDLRKATPVVKKTTLPLPNVWADPVLSPTGGRCAIISEGKMVVYDLATEKQIYSTRIGTTRATAPLRVEARFKGENSLNLITIESGTRSHEDLLRIYSIDLKKKSIVKTGEIKNLKGDLMTTLERGGRTFVLRQVSGVNKATRSLREGVTGALLATLPDGFKTTFLRNGQVVTIGRKGPRGNFEDTLIVFSDTGELLNTINLERDYDFWLMGEPEQGLLYIWGRHWNNGAIDKYSLFVANLDTGKVKKLSDGIFPLRLPGYQWMQAQDLLPFGPTAGVVVLDNGSLARINPDTGAMTVLIQGDIENGSPYSRPR